MTAMHIGVIGGGQLARMLAFAGIRLGMKFSFLIESDRVSETECIQGLGEIVVLREGTSASEIYAQMGSPDVITVEKEQVDLDLLKDLASFCPVHPNPDALKKCSHRYLEKQLLESLSIPVATYSFLSNAKEALDLPTPEFPLYAKSTRLAYDGKNQHVLSDMQALTRFANAGYEGEWIVEQGVAYDLEASIIAVRSRDGDIAFYPVTENVHDQGILIYSLSPSPNVTETVKTAMEGYARKLLEAMDYVGVLAIECFVCGEEVLVNELAPRVHNSGHWTDQSHTTSQFENHVRAVAGYKLGTTENTSASGMLNLIGTEAPPLHLLNEFSFLNWYNKEPRPGRKVGHVNFQHSSMPELLSEMRSFAEKSGVGHLQQSRNKAP